MVFDENEYVFLTDEKGSRHWLRIADGMLKIHSLGTVDGSRLKEMDDGQILKIAGKDFTIFRPTTADLMMSVERGAQIITPKDAAQIILGCDIRSGDTVLEVGAGSGALTTALLRTVAPTGRVHTIELREDHAEKAAKNVRRTGLEWTYQIGDAKTVTTDVVADVLIMDMPDPWNAIENLYGNLRAGGMFCGYVPNTNQLEDTVRKLREMGFADIHAYENIQREMDVHDGGTRPSFGGLGHTAYLIFGRKRKL